MALTESPICDFGARAPDFTLMATDGRERSLADVAGTHGTLVVFMCNHCPYVKAVRERLVETAHALADEGIGVVGIMPNDTDRYPDDSFENMVHTAEVWQLPFPYLIDETQAVARAYGAVCTPDFFGYNADLALQYRGRLDAGRTEPPPPGTRNELLEAMRLVARTGEGPRTQTPSMGCSIKWRT